MDKTQLAKDDQGFHNPAYPNPPPTYHESNPQAGYPQAGYPQPGHPQTGYPQGYSQPSNYGYNQQNTSNVVVTNAPATGYVVNAPPDRMTGAILACLCCFWPVGIFAIMKASESRSLLAAGDIDGATRASESARKLIIVSIILGIICSVIVIALRVTIVTSS